MGRLLITFGIALVIAGAAMLLLERTGLGLGSAPTVTWPVIVAVSASVARLTFTTRNLRPVLVTLLS